MAQDGLERLRRWHEDRIGVPPAVGRVGLQLTALQRGSTTVRLPLVPELLLPDGQPSGAVTALMADMALTSAVVASLPDLSGVTTIAMDVQHLADPPTRGALLARCVAAPFSGSGPQHCSGTISAADGRPVATASGWFLATPAPVEESERVGLVTEPAATSLLGLLAIPAGPCFALQVREALSNALGTLHGGIGALAAAHAAASALLPGVRPLSSTFSFLRPTPRGGSVQVIGRCVRQGRRTAVATAELLREDGAPVLQAQLVAAVR